VRLMLHLYADNKTDTTRIGTFFFLFLLHHLFTHAASCSLQILPNWFALIHSGPAQSDTRNSVEWEYLDHHLRVTFLENAFLLAVWYALSRASKPLSDWLWSYMLISFLLSCRTSRVCSIVDGYSTVAGSISYLPVSIVSILLLILQQCCA
jgi:hypothetical protein